LDVTDILKRHDFVFQSLLDIAFLATGLRTYMLHFRMSAVAKAFEITTTEAPRCAGPFGIFALDSATVAFTFLATRFRT
jgi:hypothetical protein